MTTRRDALRNIGGAIVGASVFRVFGGCGDAASATDESVPVGDAAWAASDGGDLTIEPWPDGVAVAAFDASATAIVVWAMGAAGDVLQVAVDGALATTAFVLDDGGCGAVTLTGLAPCQRHTYTVTLGDGRRAPTGVCWTRPDDDDADLDLHFAVSADVGPDVSLYDVFDVIPADLHFFVMLGDWPYADKAPAATTVDQFRAKHRQPRDAAQVKRFLARTTVFATHDDHDVTDNWDGGTAPALVATGLAVWDQFLPRQDSSTVYRRWRWGRHAEFFMLDTRRYRHDNQAVDDDAKTMLGATQRAWLIDGVTASTATFVVILTSVPLDFVDSVDSWESFTSERDAILAALPTDRTVIVISGDRHYFAQHAHASGLREFVCGPLAAGLNTPPVPLPSGVIASAVTRNFLDVHIRGGALPTLTVDARDADGVSVFTEVFTA